MLISIVLNQFCVKKYLGLKNDPLFLFAFVLSNEIAAIFYCLQRLDYCRERNQSLLLFQGLVLSLLKALWTKFYSIILLYVSVNKVLLYVQKSCLIDYHFKFLKVWTELEGLVLLVLDKKIIAIAILGDDFSWVTITCDLSSKRICLTTYRVYVLICTLIVKWYFIETFFFVKL